MPEKTRIHFGRPQWRRSPRADSEPRGIGFARPGWLLWVILLAPSPLIATGAQDASEALEQAATALQAGRADEAERLYRLVMEDHPGLVAAYRGLARALVAQGRGEEAASVLLPLGKELLEAGERHAAVELLAQAIEAHPGSAEAHYLFGRAMLSDENFEKASFHLRRAVELGHRSLAVRLYLGAALWERGRVEETEEVYRQAVARSGGSPVALHQLGGLLLWLGRYQEAVSVLRRAGTGGYRSTDLQLDLASALEGVGELEAALATYRKVVQMAPDHSRARYNLALLLARMGHRERAQRELAAYRRNYAEEQERVHQQKRDQARLNHGRELLRTGKIEEAIDHFRSLPETPESLAGLGTAFSRMGDHRAAASVLERAVSLAPERNDLKVLLTRERLAAEEIR